jgi:hypothetical protein
MLHHGYHSDLLSDEGDAASLQQGSEQGGAHKQATLLGHLTWLIP